MKILHISDAKGWGGNEQQMIYLMPSLNKLNIDNIVFGIKESVLQDECRINNIAFIAAKTKKINKLKNYWYLANVIKNHKPDIVHLHTSNSLMFFLLFNFFLQAFI